MEEFDVQTQRCIASIMPAEGIQIDKQSIEEWARNADGDIRYAITSLQFGSVLGAGRIDM